MSEAICRTILKDDDAFNKTLDRIRCQGHVGLTDTELRAIISAAERRNRIDELDEAVIIGAGNLLQQGA